MNLLKRKHPSDLPVRALQFGEGNFLRAFLDWMLDGLNRQGRFNGMVQLVQPLPTGMADAINAQDGLYTLILRGIENGKTVENRQVIECVKGCLNPYTQWGETIASAVLPTLRFVFSNTTEAGIEYKPETYDAAKCPNTYPAKLTSLLYERFKTFNGDPEKGLILIPCELIDRNGQTLRDCILRYAADWKLPEVFAAWIRDHNLFVNTLVDRIVAGYPRAEAEKLEASFGYQDKLIDCGEIFHFFVLEGPASLERELPLKAAGFHVVLTDNQAPYRTRKVRFLNGAHTADVLASILGGLTFVDEMMNDPVFGKMTRDAIYNEIFITVPLPDDEKKFFADSIVERFLNPFANHRLLSISLNSVSKWKVRVLPSLLDYVRITGTLPPVLSFSLAALIRFYRIRLAADGTASGECGGIQYPVNDAPDVLAFFASLNGRSSQDVVRAVLGNRGFWGSDLTEIPGLAAFVAEKLEQIDVRGIRETAGSLSK